MEIDFEFRKERKLGEIVQDFVNLLRLIIGHFFRTILRLAIVPLCLILVLIYYGTTKINLTQSQDFTDSLQVVGIAFACLGALVIVGMICYGFAIEYFILLKNKRNTDFTSADVWHAFRNHIGKYLKFLLIAIIALCILIIPLLLAMFILMFIPLIGSFAAGILMAFVGVWFFCAFLFYREGYMEGGNAIQQSFSLLRRKIIDYSISSYIVSFIFQALLMMLSLMPMLILGIIAYNTIGFQDTFFDSFLGRILVAIGGILFVLLYVVYYMLSVLISGIIYETAKEVNYGEDVYEKIADLGRRDDGA
ncbi:ABC transporter permease [Sphingobacterium sp. LRF_L2]|uniref:ABC transporter permease n=1 Tax=Sphingobacterium sp. LRF_L2 TaxID=3369421 RepID=UPI003F6444ED